MEFHGTEYDEVVGAVELFGSRLGPLTTLPTEKIWPGTLARSISILRKGLSKA